MKQILKKIFKKKEEKYATITPSKKTVGTVVKKPEITHNPMEETIQ